MIILRRIAIAICLIAGFAFPAAAQYSFDWQLPQQGVVSDFFKLHDFMTEFTNTGSVTDSFSVHLGKDMSPHWQATLCEGPICYPPLYVDHIFVLEPGESTNLDFAITPVTEAGRGSSVVTITSLNDPGLTALQTFTVISTGLDVLYVDASGGNDIVSFFSTALTDVGKTHAAWDRDTMGKLDVPDLANFKTVVWAAGPNGLGLDSDDMTALDSYIHGGGNLFMSGQNLTRFFCDPGSPYYTAASHAFFRDVLRTDYAADNSGSTSVAGFGADPIFAGLVYLTTGGDGANNNTSPDVLTTVSGAVAALGYGTGLPAGIRNGYGLGRTMFAGFSFEAISTGAGRTELMDVIINDWLLPRITGAPDTPPLLTDLAPQAVPNPFNPRTTISFDIGGVAAVPVQVVIHDARGRVVRRVDMGPLEPGRGSLTWDGRDDGGRALPTGIYLALVRAGDDVGTVKMTLTK